MSCRMISELFTYQHTHTQAHISAARDTNMPALQVLLEPIFAIYIQLFFHAFDQSN